MAGRVERLVGRFCSIEVQPEGAMAVPCDFDIGGRRVSPFVVAPWADEPADDPSVPPILKRLRGEWPCVPFGATGLPESLPEDWAQARTEVPDWHVADHGHSSNADWTLTARDEDGLTYGLDYPEGHPVAALHRTVRVDLNAPRVVHELEVSPRADAALPMGLHPVLRLPDTPGAARLVFPESARAWTFPVEVEPDKTALAPDQRDLPLSALRASDGSPLDPTRLPWDAETEDLLLITGTGGEATLENHDEGYAVTLCWDADALPSLMLWLSNRGRAFAPWNARFRGLGMEPVCAPFDLGPAFTGPNTPLAHAGVPTSVRLTAGEAWRTRLSMSVKAL
ncbi:hypothetical protein [Pelagovum pacificum]|uniref:Aldose 1-epimerase n=1 Tax=Pelagovum pacificum TaxID=2588711 RepID=A0A5C5GGT5_9RHOB|nr:hypothetical protein [Pelagovum pacificum]QQA43636.1 hypothetical protein I8N54_03400 [Pelagovum pacificum]TNY33229.1 hypothetical protein FHY64_08130 [Pelagovum pacificum]